jgi:hypothetical protein
VTGSSTTHHAMDITVINEIQANRECARAQIQPPADETSAELLVRQSAPQNMGLVAQLGDVVKQVFETDEYAERR